MNSVLPIVLFGAAGILVGGAWSLHRQGAARSAVVLVGALATLAAVTGVLWLLPEP
ncbi:MAG: hypothetical protein ACM30G_08490 [Micromonosporaceae bacterium]